MKNLFHDLLTGKGILLLLGGLAIGLLCGKKGFEQVAPLFDAPFKGVITLFLLEVGLVTGRRLHDLKAAGWRLVAFALIMLLTIIAEDELESRLIADLKRLGVRGYTICTVRGDGGHGLRASQWEGENIKIEVIVDNVLADTIGEHVANTYFPHFATILYLLPVQVLREEKSTKPNTPQAAEPRHPDQPA